MTNYTKRYIIVVSQNLLIKLFASTSFLVGLTDVMAVTLTDPYGNFVINQTLGRDGITTYAVTDTSQVGFYRATFAVTKHQKWNSSAGIVDYNAPSYYTSEPDNIIVDAKGNKYYYIPTELDASSQCTQRFSRNNLDVDELYEQFWDNGLNDYVYNLPSFSIGDDLIITDTVQNMTYEPDADRTILEFNTRRGTAYWPFDGNLMNQIFVGDQISFSFNVVEQYTSGEHVFESLNYFQNAQAKLFDSSVKLDINNYLVK